MDIPSITKIAKKFILFKQQPCVNGENEKVLTPLLRKLKWK